MSGKKFSFLVPIVLLSGLWTQQDAAAIDGDMVYSAPYVIFNEETGKLETVNPGPRLKAHEAETADPDGGEPATAEAMSAARPIDTDADLANELYAGRTFSQASYDRTETPFADMRARIAAEERAAREVGADIATRLAAYFASR